MNAAHPSRPPRETRFIDGDVALNLFRWERPGAPRMLLVHGIGLGHSVYDRFIDEISPSADVLAVDLPGFGSCPEPAVALSIPELADLLAAAVIDAGVAPLVAVGHSMGGQVVAELAARHPELVERVVLIASSVNPAERNVWLQAYRMIQDIAEGEPRSVISRSSRTYLQAGPRWFAKQLKLMLAHRIEDTLPRIEQPALVLRGARDRVSPRRWAVRMCGLLPRAEMRQIPDRGHEALISSGEPVARIVCDWIRDD